MELYNSLCFKCVKVECLKVRYFAEIVAIHKSELNTNLVLICQ
jgi:hypothetical protein